MRYLPLTDLTALKFDPALRELVAEYPGQSVSIVSPLHGPICGFVPNDSDGSVVVTLRDEYFQCGNLGGN